MTVTSKISINDGNLVVHGKTILTGVPDNIVLTPGSGVGLVSGAFIGATASDSKSLHVFPGSSILCLFRFKLWWMTLRMGTCGSDVPLETQFMLVESKDDAEGGDQDNAPTIYTVFLPLLEGQFRAVLQGNERNELEICLESGDNVVETNQGLYLVYMHAGTNPFEVINQAVKALEKHLQTLLHREKKKDAFYTDVIVEGVEEGLKSLSKEGTPPQFLLIDDGWQQIEKKPKESDCVVQEGAQFVYVWHALAGYWGGVKLATIDIVMDNLAVHGLGLVHPKKVLNFYNELHAYLASCGVDGVEVDVQNIIETLGAGHGGRVSLTRSYIQALEASISRNFPDNGCIACMCHNIDGIYSAKQTAVVRASDDFYPRDPASHTIHISSVAIFLGEFMRPDWDMFHVKLTPATEYHAAARAVGGCPIYVSDKLGNHNFELLKKLVLLDGSVLRAQLPGRPTRDCLFVDPTRDGLTQTVNKCSGVVGVFNCQGASWCKVTKKTCIHDASPGTLTSSIRATDVDLIAQIAGLDWKGETIVYAHRSGEVIRLPKDASVPVTLKVLDYDAGNHLNISFAPIGLLDMLNSSCAVEQVEVHLASDKKPEHFDGEVSSELTTTLSDNRSPTATIALKVRGCRRFGAYSSQRPLKCRVGNVETYFNYDFATGLLTLTLPVPQEDMYRWPVEIQV
ncbi:hypothetical protein SLEP1_g41188 [Rubroshorea leprosula]|uniref:Galactinol--sucrose galactosyltransferase n=1 Tax=Rubroshorea leprosula TaxID=152421 RepID=A0AAV5L643_9ROSI|nr:hypothetical protein SLEP1_g41188 [Rubroshorea leprosula]